MLNVYDLFTRINEVAPPIRLDVGQPDIPVREEIIEAAVQSLRSGETGYTEATGLPELREAIANLEGTSPGEVIVGAGAKLLISAEIAMAKSVAIISPFWNAYILISKEFGKRIQIIRTELENRWVPDKIEVNADLLVLNYPNNPTGRVLSQRELEPILEAASKRGVKILSDETYSEISFVNYTPIRELYENTVTVKSFSKLYSMTGFRLGYAIAPQSEIEHLKRFIESSVTCVPIFVQRAGLKSLELRKEIKRDFLREYKRRAERAGNILHNLNFYPPEGTYYIFLKVPMNGDKLAETLLRRGVAVFPGSLFGNYSSFVRISLTHRDFEEGLMKLREVITCSLE